MTLANILLPKRHRKSEWYDRICECPLTIEEREAIDAIFSRHNPTFGQAFAICEIERKYLTLAA